MDKILVSLWVPGLNEAFDILVPGFLSIEKLIPLFTEALYDITGGEYVTSGGEILCREVPYEILNEEYTLREYGVLNGDRLILF